MLKSFTVLALLAAASLGAFPSIAQQSATVQSRYLPKVDPAKDLEKAKAAAASQGKRVLLVVGGDWCPDCIILQSFLNMSQDVKAEFDKTFITAKVYVGPDNLNADFLGTYPEIEWVPQFFVLDAKGKLLKAQDTRDLSDDRRFHKDKMLAFAHEWRLE